MPKSDSGAEYGQNSYCSPSENSGDPDPSSSKTLSSRSSETIIKEIEVNILMPDLKTVRTNENEPIVPSAQGRTGTAPHTLVVDQMRGEDQVGSAARSKGKGVAYSNGGLEEVDPDKNFEGHFRRINRQVVLDLLLDISKEEYWEARNLISPKFSPKFKTSAPDGCRSLMAKDETYVAVHYDSIKAGLRFPLHPFLVKVLLHYNLVPAMIPPNGHRLITLFLMGHALLGKEPTLELFQYMFNIYEGFGELEGFVLFQSRPYRRMVEKIPKSIKSWKRKYFFVKLEQDEVGFVNQWPSKVTKVANPSNSDALDKDVAALRALQLDGLNGITPKILSDLKLGPPILDQLDGSGSSGSGLPIYVGIASSGAQAQGSPPIHNVQGVAEAADPAPPKDQGASRSAKTEPVPSIGAQTSTPHVDTSTPSAILSTSAKLAQVTASLKRKTFSAGGAAKKIRFGLTTNHSSSASRLKERVIQSSKVSPLVLAKMMSRRKPIGPMEGGRENRAKHVPDPAGSPSVPPTQVSKAEPQPANYGPNEPGFIFDDPSAQVKTSRPTHEEVVAGARSAEVAPPVTSSEPPSSSAEPVQPASSKGQRWRRALREGQAVDIGLEFLSRVDMSIFNRMSSEDKREYFLVQALQNAATSTMFIDQNAELEAELEEARKKISAQAGQLEEAKESLWAEQAKTKKLEKRVSELEKDVGSLALLEDVQKRFGGMVVLAKVQQANLHGLHQELTSLRSAHSELQRSCVTNGVLLNHSLAQVEQVEKSFTSELADAEDELPGLPGKIIALRKERTRAINDAAKLQSSKAELEERVRAECRTSVPFLFEVISQFAVNEDGQEFVIDAVESNPALHNKLEESRAEAALQGMQMMQKTIYEQLEVVCPGFKAGEWGLPEEIADSESEGPRSRAGTPPPSSA
nr:Bromodomain adjacent to zinc finger domain 1A [Ipomoea batatas]